MANSTINLTNKLREYLLSVSIRESDVEHKLRNETSKLEAGIMQIAPEQAQFMTLVVKSIKAKSAIEIGTFTGYSALAIAKALPKDGKLIACDINKDWTNIGQRYWKEAGVANKIDLRIAPALDTLRLLLDSGMENSIDFAFIDADKQNQIQYYEHCLSLIRPGGLIMVDNVLWGGSVADAKNQEEDTEAIRRCNLHIHADNRVDISMIPVGDGLTLAYKLEH